MKRSVRMVWCWSVLFTGFILAKPGEVEAQTFSNLYSFAATAGPAGTNTNGGYPGPGLVLAGNTLYGITGYGGTSGKGAVFKFNLNGGTITNLHSFSALSSPAPGTNIDGASPHGDLILGGDTLYGTTYEGGASGYGAVFAVKTNGTSFTNLYSFSAPTGPSLTNRDGASPDNGLVLVGDILFGMTSYGGTASRGTIFAIKTNGIGFTNLHNFTGFPNDGGSPQTSLLLAGGLLYGTTSSGGSAGAGTLFVLNTNGTGYTTLRSFLGGTNDGQQPSRVILSGGVLYGTTYGGGMENAGTAFKVSANGTGYTNLHSFTQTSGGGFPSESSDGTGPQGALVIIGNTLYGMTGFGGIPGYGVQFAVNTNGTGFTVLHHNNYSDGYFGRGGMILSGNTFYGTETAGGGSGSGTIFSFTLPLVGPQLAIVRAGANVIVSWPTNDPGFVLQFTTNLVSPILWGTSSPAPVIVSGQNAVTNPAVGGKQFYRLIR